MKEDLPIESKLFENFTATRMLFSSRFFFLILVIIGLACDQRKDLVDAPLYDGPLSSMDSAFTLLSDSGIVVMEMKAPKQNNFENGDREWPEGFRIQWFNSRGQKKSYFSANYVYFTKADNLYKAQGDVIVKSYVKKDELNTEELFWDQGAEKFYTYKFVTINSDDEVHTGEGMEANQDFTSYRILKPNGTFHLEDDPTRPQERAIPLSSTREN